MSLHQDNQIHDNDYKITEILMKTRITMGNSKRRSFNFAPNSSAVALLFVCSKSYSSSFLDSKRFFINKPCFST